MGDLLDLEEQRKRRTPGWTSFISFEERPEGCSCADFVLGFESGVLHTRLQEKSETWGGTYHAKNLVMIQRIAEASGYEVRVTPTEDETWIFVDFILLGGRRD